MTLQICIDFYMTFVYGKRQFDDVNTVKKSGSSSLCVLFLCFRSSNALLRKAACAAIVSFIKR